MGKLVINSYDEFAAHLGEELAIGISSVTGLPIVNKALRRNAFQQSQTSLNRWQRQENVADTFELHDDSQLRNRHVLLIDDVCTTGATKDSDFSIIKIRCAPKKDTPYNIVIEKLLMR